MAVLAGLAWVGARALALVLTGHHDEARALVEKSLPEWRWRNSPALLVALRELGETERAAEFARDIDSLPGLANTTLMGFIDWRGGKLIWDLEWTPYFAARLEELGVELEQYEFPPPAE